METDKQGKRMAVGLVLFFLIVIILGIFVGKELVGVVKASKAPGEKIEMRTVPNQEPIEQSQPEQKSPIEPMELAGGYPNFTPTPWLVSTPTRTATAVPTRTATSTPTNTPTNTATSTATPTSTATSTSTATPTSTATSTPTRTPSKPPTVGPAGNPKTYVGAGIVFALVGLAGFILYFWNIAQIKRGK